MVKKENILYETRGENKNLGLIYEMCKNTKNEIGFVVYHCFTNRFEFMKVIPAGLFGEEIQEIHPDPDAPYRIDIFTKLDNLDDISYENIFADVRKYIFKHIDFPKKADYDILSHMIMLSWVIDLIPEDGLIAPYVLFLAPRESGKTRALEVCNALCYRSYNSGGISAAALRRDLHDYHITPALDEGEYQLERDRKSVV